MVDNEKRDNLANARRKLKKFRDEQLQLQSQNGNNHLNLSSESNGTNTRSISSASPESLPNHATSSISHAVPQDVATFVNEQQSVLNGIHVNLSKSPVLHLEEQNRQYAILIENQKQQRARLEDQRLMGGGSAMSGRSSRTQSESDVARQIEQKYRRDLDHLQEQLEIHIQTIGVLVAEKTDLSAKLTQSSKQLERKQHELDEVQGRLKASRDRVDELEKQTQNSSFHAQKHEMAVKESDKEIDRLRIENARQCQMIEDLNQNLAELDKKFNSRHSTIDQLNNEILKLKQKLEHTEIRLQQVQSITDTSLINQFEQQIQELQRTVSLKTNEAEVLLASINQMRTDYDQMHIQYQQYNVSVQQHIQELKERIDQLVQTNTLLENEQDAIKQAYEMKLTEMYNEQKANHQAVDSNMTLERDSLIQENQLFKTAVNEWSQRFEDMRIENENIKKMLAERDARIGVLEKATSEVHESQIHHEKLLQNIHEDKTTLSRAIAQNKQLKDQLAELQDGFVRISNDNMNLTNQLQAQEHINKQLNEHLTQRQSQETVNTIQNQQQIQTDSNIKQEQQEDTTKRLNELLEENALLRKRLSQLELHVESQPSIEVKATNSNSLLSLGSINDDATHQFQTGFVDKIIERFNRAMRDNADLQDRAQQLEHIILQLQSETETIGDYVYLYQQQRQQLHRRYQEKDDYIKQLTHDRLSLQRKLSELETLLVRGLNKSSLDKLVENPIGNGAPPSQPPATDDNEWPEMVDNVSSSSVTSEESSTPNKGSASILDSTSLPSLSTFDDDTKMRILALLKELGETSTSSAKDDSSSAKLAFIDKNIYVCSTCSGPVQWV